MVSSELWFGASASFYNGVATQSLRFDDGSVHKLTKDFSGSAPTNNKKMVISVWVKRGNLDSTQVILSAYSAVYFVGELAWHSSNKLRFDPGGLAGGSQNSYTIETDDVFRDVSSWYHVVLAYDSTQNTDSNRVKFYVNGTEKSHSPITNSTYPALNYAHTYSYAGANNEIGNYTSVSSAPLDAYLAEFNFIDGASFFSDTSGTISTTFNVNSFGETKNGIWIPIEYTGSYGNNGYRLDFKGTGTSTSSGAVANPTNIGDDSSGNNNHWAVSGNDANDCVPDSPENNFCTLNPLVVTASATNSYAEGNLQGGTSSTGGGNITGTMAIPSEGKWYYEFRSTAIGSGINLGLWEPNANEDFFYQVTPSIAYLSSSGSKRVNNSTSSYGASWNSSNTMGVAVDIDGGTVTFYKDNASQGSISFDASGLLPVFGDNTGGSGCTARINFGQDSTFSGEISAGGNKDANGIGDFAYSPPSNHLALCTANLPETTISPNQTTQAENYFDALLYNGTGNDNLDISGLSFQPDLIWKKSRDENVRNTWTDSNRGVGKDLFSDLNGAESADTANIKEFRSDGFRLGTSTNGNVNGIKYVSWNWLANGTTPSKTYKVKVVADSTDYGHGTGSNKYQFFKSDGTTGFGTNGVDLDLQEGGTYTFDWSDSTAQSHPIRFSLTNDGTHSSGTSAGSEYTTGVTKNDSAYTTTITVASGVASLYYYCQYHSGMGAEVKTNTTHGSTNFDGNILSVSNVNETSGFGIVTYTGINGATTVGHGLGKIPAMVIVKQRDNASTDWIIGHQKLASSAFANNKFLKFDRGNGTFTNSAVFGATPTETAIQVSTTTAGNLSQASTDFVMYCFAEVEGFSKMGSYVTNASANGSFVYTGFKPAFVMVRVIDGSSNTNYWSWTIHDNARKTANVRHSPLYANLYRPEPYRGDDSTSSGGADVKMDFYSNGFKDRSGATEQNGVAGTNIIYMAFASAPFKYANAE